MTIQTLTSNPQAQPDASAHAGLPDLGVLTQLANELFSSLPGGGTPQPTGVPAAAPAPLPHEAPLQATPPAGVADGLDLGSPQAYSAAIPQVYPGAATVAPTGGGAPAPAAPYYFTGEEAGYPAASGSEAAPVRESRIDAQPYALPGGDALGDILQSIVSEPRATSAAPSSRSSGGHFYFLDDAGRAPGIEKAPERSGQPQAAATGGLDVQAVRRDFPILAERVNGKPLVWFDNAATTQKPRVVIDRVSYFYEHENSNIHRAAHELAARATDAYEGARNSATRLLGARSSSEIIFVRGATEGINLIANTFGRKYIGAGDEIIVSNLEHHANIVPWQLLAKEVGAKLRVIPVDDSGQILLEEYAKLLNPRTRLVSVTQVSNALGTVTPVQEIIALAHAAGARVLIDGAQSVSHMRVNVQALDADFFVFSGHKVFGPTGIGVVYGKKDLLDTLPPWQGGGNMIADVTFEHTQFQPAPARFEAGTGNIADAVGLGAALDYVERIGLENIYRYEHDLLVYATRGLTSIPGLRLIGTAAHKASVLSFVLDGYRTEEVGAALNREGIAVRSGHHCAQPILRRFGVEATVRPSLAFYNTVGEVDLLVDTVRRLAHAKGGGRRG
ncbi:family 2A encapsulin nanocompartment cargo protein cysteine desulfurase [Stutzerimonas kirkiae]|uniref:family 2A encapsulin nanocompartment cargo protein cysteine desulfurase n=1 Tax=Stutzerimonas kirkiae TaxID=2211392 RepID=UPI0010383825|nr:family 2A encapsulin nanocompartment cargo protein cysteine desulfurase [Stutzerimonas kirkiae]TBV07455.1 cysteine desulfurase [Stutzerimonas kirkiae]TBV11088.1 cysteine desulfurase [Stutzerimonas kirkiae]